MEVRIGIKHSARELSFETDASADEIRSLVDVEGSSLVSLSDTKGRQFLVNRESISYIELGRDTSRKVGFIS